MNLSTEKLRKNVFVLFFILPLFLFSQTEYLNYDQMTNKVRELDKASNCEFVSYGKSFSNKDLWALIIGDKTKPAVLIVAGLDGRHQAGTQFSLLLAENLLKNETAQSLLKDKSILIIPNGNPDAMDAYFDKIKYEKSGNKRISDDDRNGKLSDDPYDDLNGDGVITMMRVTSALGDHIISNDDSKIMVPADVTKNMKGTHLLFTEGIDNNKNGKYNEDPSNGVNLDKNFAFDYPVFTLHAGEYAVSERESRSLMDFLSAHRNIHTVISIGPQNSLTEPLKYDAKAAEQRIIRGWLEKDIKVSENISKSYNKFQVLKKSPKLPLQNGSFVQTAYYHGGKYAFSTPVWWAYAEDKKDTTAASKSEKETPKSGNDNYESQYLKWMDRENLTEMFTAWKEVKHPDFPSQKVEVGGIKPYALYNPPIKYIKEQIDGHTGFLNELLSKLPTHEIVEPKVEKVNSNLFRVTIKAVNKGFMPSYTGVNDKLRLTSRLKTEIIINKSQSILAGRKIELNNALQPNESREHSWLISGTGSISIETGCATTGISKLTIDLK